MAMYVSNFSGAETGGFEETRVVSGSPTVQSSVVKNGVYAYQLLGTTPDEIVTWIFNPAGRGNNYVQGAWIRLSAIATTTNPCCLLGYKTVNNSLGDDIGGVWLDSSGNLIYRDANGVTQLTVNNPPIIADTWHFMELYFAGSPTVGFLEFFIDGVSQGSQTGMDTEGTAATVEGVGFGSTSTYGLTMYVDDWYCLSGLTSSTERLGNSQVFAYRSNKASAVADVGEVLAGGNDLNAGTWADIQQIPFDEANTASFTNSTAGGAVYTDDVGGSAGTGGLATDRNITGRIVGGKYACRLKRGTGGGTTHVMYLGNDVDGLTRTGALGLTTTYLYYQHVLGPGYGPTLFPRSNEIFVMGFATLGAQDIICSDMLATILHVPKEAIPPFNPVTRFRHLLVR